MKIALLINTFIIFPALLVIDLFVFNNPPFIYGLYTTFFISILTALFLHKYFSHRHFELARPTEVAVGFLCASTFQFDPVLWASIHRFHHKNSDTENDLHSPHSQSLLEALVLWSFRKKAWVTRHDTVTDLLAKPDLKFYNQYPFFAPFTMTGLIFIVIYLGLMQAQGGLLLSSSRAIDAFHFCLWSYPLPCYVMVMLNGVVSTSVHLFGYQTYDTHDHSKNSFLLGLLFLGEGWHNNHHKQPHLANFGHKWWQIDLSYWMLCVLKILRVAK